MFGNKNKGNQYQQVDNESGIQQQPRSQQQQHVSQNETYNEVNVDSAKINEIEQSITNLVDFVKEQARISTEIAARLESLEGTSSPMLTRISDDKRLGIIEQNMLSHQLTMEAIVDAITNLTNEFNKMVEDVPTKKGKVKESASKRKDEYEDEDDEESDLI